MDGSANDQRSMTTANRERAYGEKEIRARYGRQLYSVAYCVALPSHRQMMVSRSSVFVGALAPGKQTDKQWRDRGVCEW